MRVVLGPNVSRADAAVSTAAGRMPALAVRADSSEDLIEADRGDR